jgi:hypothetical protein
MLMLAIMDIASNCTGGIEDTGEKAKLELIKEKFRLLVCCLTLHVLIFPGESLRQSHNLSRSLDRSPFLVSTQYQLREGRFNAAFYYVTFPMLF